MGMGDWDLGFDSVKRVKENPEMTDKPELVYEAVGDEFELKPCPLCGGVPEVYFDGDYYTESEFRIRCTECDLHLFADIGETTLKRVDEDATNRWNRRSKAPPA